MPRKPAPPARRRRVASVHDGAEAFAGVREAGRDAPGPDRRDCSILVLVSFVPATSAQAFESAEGRIVVWFPAPCVAAARCVGHVTGEVTRRAYELTDNQEVTPYEGFLDMRETTGFDWEARGRALKWNIMHLSAKMRLHVLVASPPLRLAFKVFERALRDHVEIHSDPTCFESAYALAVKRHTRAWSTSPVGGA